MRVWNNKNGIYQIYPRSFYDSSGNGVGDIRGIIEKLDYIKGEVDSLGIDAIWLSPFFLSPMRDFGYDVADYRQVDPLFGTLADFDELIREAHAREIAVMIDFIPNHTSTEHPWFKQALADPSSDRRAYYVFRDAAPGGGPPNNWKSVFGGSAWEYDGESGQYYLHTFLPEQADLDWTNPVVQHEMAEVAHFWFRRGVDGLRIDAVRWLAKDPLFRDDTPRKTENETNEYETVEHDRSRGGENLEEYLSVLTSAARQYDDRLIIFEYHIDPRMPYEAQAVRMYNVSPQYAAPFNFDGIFVPFSARQLGETIKRYQLLVPKESRAFYCFSNHDEPRLASRVGERQARAMAVLQLTLPGTPVIYYGQELGMKNVVVPEELAQDPVKGAGNRDGERTPMQWSGERLAGFTTANQPWLPVAPDFEQYSVASEENDTHSSLSLYKTLLRLRKDEPALAPDALFSIDLITDALFAFTRTSDAGTLCIVINFSDAHVHYEFKRAGSCIVSAQGNTYEETSGEISIEPFDAIVFRVQQF